jgi:hypothetical protein
MRKHILFFTLVFALVATPVREAEAANPWAAVIKAAIKKVVKAVDLMIQRRQNKVIRLQNAQKAIENTMAKLQLDEITDWVKKQRDLYKKYYDELKKVKAVIAYYFKIKQIADQNSKLVDEYRRFWGWFPTTSILPRRSLVQWATNISIDKLREIKPLLLLAQNTKISN